jgi:MoxR-like ATPase
MKVVDNKTKDRCLYLFIDYPSLEREIEIVNTLIPDAPQNLVENVVKAIQQIRKMNLLKKPSIRATVDWVKTLITLKHDKLDDDSFKDTVGVVLKNQDDKKKLEGYFLK